VRIGVSIWNMAAQASRSLASTEGVEEDAGMAAASMPSRLVLVEV